MGTRTLLKAGSGSGYRRAAAIARHTSDHLPTNGVRIVRSCWRNFRLDYETFEQCCHGVGVRRANLYARRGTRIDPSERLVLHQRTRTPPLSDWEIHYERAVEDDGASLFLRVLSIGLPVVESLPLLAIAALLWWLRPNPVGHELAAVS